MSSKRINSSSPFKLGTPISKRARLSSPSTPWTPLHSFTAVPSDSPTNPCGRNLACSPGQPLCLPLASSFSKHLPLRMQLVLLDDAGEAQVITVYRIVQVPTNYTFRHLHRLILFVFDGVPFGINSRKRIEASPHGLDSGVGDSHCFRLMKDVVLQDEEEDEKVDGVIVAGDVWVSIRPHSEDEDEEDLAAESATESKEQERWETEEDMTVGNIWPLGSDMERGAIYYHDAHTEIHITLNTRPLPKRKGVGNQPYIFCGHGLVRLTPSINAGDYDARKRHDIQGSRKVRRFLERWNADGAFANYLATDCHRNRDNTQIADSQSSPPRSSPTASGVTFSSSSPLTEASFPPVHSPPSLPLLHIHTPEPKTKLQRMSIHRAHRRLARLSKRLQSDEEGEDIFEGPFTEDGDDDEQEEVDELIDNESAHD